jgi:hypothetical protein
MRTGNSGGGIEPFGVVSKRKRGTGPASAGQCGDTQGLPDIAEAGAESIEELVEEGQFFEAELMLGVERADEGELSAVRTHQVPEDDVPAEYLDED